MSDSQFIFATMALVYGLPTILWLVFMYRVNGKTINHANPHFENLIKDLRAKRGDPGHYATMKNPPPPPLNTKSNHRPENIGLKRQASPPPAAAPKHDKCTGDCKITDGCLIRSCHTCGWDDY